jgi:predicted methyltransferase MtxX (methanogen marker protein 4)
VAIVVFASWIADEVEKCVLAGVVGVDEKSRIRLLKLAADHGNTFAPGGRAAVTKSPGRDIGEYDKDSVVGRMLDASH